MLRREAIERLEDPRLAPYRTLRAQFDHLAGGVFVAEGDKVVRRLLDSPCPVISVLLTPKWEAEFAPRLQKRSELITLFVAEKSLLEQLTGFPLFQGLLALARVPRPLTVAELLEAPAPQLLAAFDGLSSAENLGVALRNVAALGGQGVVIGETSAHPFLRRAVRNSMGAVFRLPYARTPDLMETLAELGRRGICRIAAHPHADQTALWDCDLTRPACLVFGSEGYGLRAPVLAACDAAVAIPMRHDVDSLNVANAVAVFFAEAQRQRSQRDGPLRVG